MSEVILCKFYPADEIWASVEYSSGDLRTKYFLEEATVVKLKDKIRELEERIVDMEYSQWEQNLGDSR